MNRPGGRGGAARSFDSLAELAPGAQNDAYGVSINGTTSPENGYVVDGLSTNDPAFGIIGTPLTIDGPDGPVHVYGIPYLEPAIVRHRRGRSTRATLAR